MTTRYLGNCFLSCLVLVRETRSNARNILLVVGDCFAARPQAQTPTTAVGGLRNTNSGEEFALAHIGYCSFFYAAYLRQWG